MIDIAHVASVTHGYVGADLESLVKESALKSLHRKIAIQKQTNQIVSPIVSKEGTIPNNQFFLLRVDKD